MPINNNLRIRDAYDLPDCRDKVVLVTGATGFTGAALAFEMKRRGYHVRALVRDAHKAEALRHAGIALFVGDITDSDAVMRAVEGVSLIQHIAAVFRTAGHTDCYYHDVNHHAVKNIIAAARTHGVRRTVHCSTVGVHGHVSQVPSNEDSPYNPGDIYQVTKLEGEKRMQEAMADGFPGVIFRPAGIYGPGDLRFLKVFKNVQRGRFPIFGTGEVTYHFTFVDDLVDGIIRCGEHPDAVGEIFVLGGDEFISLNEFIELVAIHTGGRVPKMRWPITPLLLSARICEAICKPLRIDPPLHVRRCEFFVKARAFSNEKAKRIIGWYPRTSIDEGVRKTATWYVEQGLIADQFTRLKAAAT